MPTAIPDITSSFSGLGGYSEHYRSKALHPSHSVLTGSSRGGAQLLSSIVTIWLEIAGQGWDTKVTADGVPKGTRLSRVAQVLCDYRGNLLAPLPTALQSGSRGCDRDGEAVIR